MIKLYQLTWYNICFLQLLVITAFGFRVGKQNCIRHMKDVGNLNYQPPAEIFTTDQHAHTRP